MENEEEPPEDPPELVERRRLVIMSMSRQDELEMKRKEMIEKVKDEAIKELKKQKITNSTEIREYLIEHYPMLLSDESVYGKTTEGGEKMEGGLNQLRVDKEIILREGADFTEINTKIREERESYEDLKRKYTTLDLNLLFDVLELIKQQELFKTSSRYSPHDPDKIHWSLDNSKQVLEGFNEDIKSHLNSDKFKTFVIKLLKYQIKQGSIEERDRIKESLRKQALDSNVNEEDLAKAEEGNDPEKDIFELIMEKFEVKYKKLNPLYKPKVTEIYQKAMKGIKKGGGKKRAKKKITKKKKTKKKDKHADFFAEVLREEINKLRKKMSDVINANFARKETIMEAIHNKPLSIPLRDIISTLNNYILSDIDDAKCSVEIENKQAKKGNKLIQAVKDKNIKKVTEILEKGLEVDGDEGSRPWFPDEYGITALHYACGIDPYSDIEGEDENKITEGLEKNVTILKLLTDEKYHPACRESKKIRTICSTINISLPKCMGIPDWAKNDNKSLICGYTRNRCTKLAGMTPLHVAVKRIVTGPYPTDSRRRPTHINPLKEMIQNLLERGANPNLTDYKGCVPLSELILWGFGHWKESNKDIIRLLLMYGTDTDTKNTSPHADDNMKDKSLREYAEGSGFNEFITMIDEINANKARWNRLGEGVKARNKLEKTETHKPVYDRTKMDIIKEMSQENKDEIIEELGEEGWKRHIELLREDLNDPDRKEQHAQWEMTQGQKVGGMRRKKKKTKRKKQKMKKKSRIKRKSKVKKKKTKRKKTRKSKGGKKSKEYFQI